jgi:hypothetical protein
MKAVSPQAATARRSTDWSKERIGGLATADISQLRLNAERLNDPDIVSRCDEVLRERKAAEKAARAAARKNAAPAAPAPSVE